MTCAESGGRLFPCALSEYGDWERIASRWRPAFSSHPVSGLFLPQLEIEKVFRRLANGANP